MPVGKVNTSSTVAPTAKEQVSSAGAPKFQGKEVSNNDSTDALASSGARSPSSLGECKDIQSREVKVGADAEAQAAVTDGQSDTASFYSAAESLDDVFLDTNNFFVDESAAESYASGTAQQPQVNQQAVQHLEDADGARLHQYIDEFVAVNRASNAESGIATDLEERLQSLVDYNERLDTDMQHLNGLADKLQQQGLSQQEGLEMKALLHCHKYNLSTVQNWLSATQALRTASGAMNEPTASLFTALTSRFAMRHMELADTLSLYEDRLPDQEPVSRNDRIGYNLLTARAGLRAFKTLTMGQKDTNPEAFEKMKEIYRPLVRHCKALEHALKVSQGRAEMDANNPQLNIESLDAWTEGFDLVESKTDDKALPQQAVDELQQRWEGDSPSLPLSHSQLSQRDMTKTFIEHQLAKAGVDTSRFPAFNPMFKRSLIIEINQSEWPVIDKPLQFDIGGKEHTCHSRITPGMHLAERFEKGYKYNGIACIDRLQTEHAPNMAHTQLTAENGKLLFSGVRHGIIDPYDYTNEKVKNFSDEQLYNMVAVVYDDRQKARNNVDFDNIKQQLQDLESGIEPEAVPVAVHTGSRPGRFRDKVIKPASRQYLERQLELRDQAIRGIVREIKADPKERKNYIEGARDTAARKMARELLTAAVVSDPEKLNAALAGETIDVNINSIALVTPDWVRARYLTGSARDERQMLQRQSAALQALDRGNTFGAPTTLKVRDNDGALKEIKVNARVRTLNFGVNDYAVARTIAPSNFPIWRRLMGWRFASRVNNPQLQDLLGPAKGRELGGIVAEKLQSLEQSGTPEALKQATLLREAATQARAIWRSRSFRSGNNEPYKMVSRLALISHLMGDNTLFNCKSGKDRTGQLDAEVKYLAAVGHATGHIPEPDIAHTAESRKMRTTFTLDAGNMELQRINTGLPGYKLRNVPGLIAMLEEGKQGVYEGGSGYIRA